MSRAIGLELESRSSISTRINTARCKEGPNIQSIQAQSTPLVQIICTTMHFSTTFIALVAATAAFVAGSPVEDVRSALYQLCLSVKLTLLLA